MAFVAAPRLPNVADTNLPARGWTMRGAARCERSAHLTTVACRNLERGKGYSNRTILISLAPYLHMLGHYLERA